MMVAGFEWSPIIDLEVQLELVHGAPPSDILSSASFVTVATTWSLKSQVAGATIWISVVPGKIKKPMGLNRRDTHRRPAGRGRGR